MLTLGKGPRIAAPRPSSLPMQARGGSSYTRSVHKSVLSFSPSSAMSYRRSVHKSVL